MKHKLFVFLVLGMALLLSCCDAAPEIPQTEIPPEITYISADVTYSEPAEQYAFRLNMDFTETTYAKFYFEPEIDPKERDACIEVTQNVLSRQTLTNQIPEIYIFTQERYDYRYCSENKLYLPVQDWKSVEYITDVLLIAYSKSAHYGTAFGYANYLAKSNQWGGCDGTFTNPSVVDTLDLNYLCFDENFTAADDVSAAKSIACDFADSYIRQYGAEQALQQLLHDSADATAALTSYYKEHGVSYVPSVTSYGYGGKSYDYVVYSDCGTFYIANNWTDIHAQYNPLITEGFLHTDYAQTKAFFETNLKQMKQYQQLFQLDGYDHDLDIVFANPINTSPNSYYHGGIHCIYLYHMDSLMHEYIHSLVKPTASMELWQVEGFTRYFSYYYDRYGVAFLNQDYNNTPDIPELKYIHEYLADINRPIEIEKDFSALENIAVYSRSWTNPNENYLTGSSFVQYLVKQYGEEAVIQSIYGNGEALPKTQLELVREWNEYIESQYTGYSKFQ